MSKNSDINISSVGACWILQDSEGTITHKEFDAVYIFLTQALAEEFIEAELDETVEAYCLELDDLIEQIGGGNIAFVVSRDANDKGGWEIVGCQIIHSG